MITNFSLDNNTSFVNQNKNLKLTKKMSSIDENQSVNGCLSIFRACMPKYIPKPKTPNIDKVTF